MNGRAWLLVAGALSVMTVATASRAAEDPVEVRHAVNGSGTATEQGQAQAAEVAADAAAQGGPVTTGSNVKEDGRPLPAASARPPYVSPAAPAAPAPPVAPPTKALAEPVGN